MKRERKRKKVRIWRDWTHLLSHIILVIVYFDETFRSIINQSIAHISSILIPQFFCFILFLYIRAKIFDLLLHFLLRTDNLDVTVNQEFASLIVLPSGGRSWIMRVVCIRNLLYFHYGSGKANRELKNTTETFFFLNVFMSKFSERLSQWMYFVFLSRIWQSAKPQHYRDA